MAAAAAALLGTTARPAEASDFDTSLLFYTEIDRVTAFEAAATVRKPLGEGSRRFLDLGFVVDILTGASANGANATDRVQTFTRPSGHGSYSVPAGDTPLDDTFQDNRGEFSAGLEVPIGSLTRVGVGGTGSIEYDYRSLSARALVEQDLFQRNTTLSLSLAHAWDSVDPEGGIPIPFASMRPAGAPPARSGATDDKQVTDLLLRAAQVVSRSTIGQITYSHTRSTGYHTDPFKLLSLIDGETGSPVAYVFENRPRDRTKQSVYLQVKRHMGRDIAEAAYRYLWDDWGVRSHTLDIHYRFRFSGKHLQPHVRIYRQAAADFYRTSLTFRDPFPEFATADYRQGAFTGVTLGLRMGRTMGVGNDLGLRIEYYLQSGDEPEDAVGVQRQMDLFPDIGALIAQITYSFEAW